MDTHPSIDKELLRRIASYCARAERSPRQIAAWLLRHQVDVPLHDMYWLRLKELNFVDEERFASSFASDKMLFAHWGPLKVRSQLKLHGIPASIIDQVIREVSDEEGQTKQILQELLQKKNNMIVFKNDYDRRQKLFRYGLSKGFSYEQIADALRYLDVGDDDFSL